ncbi:hypothetical protein BYT27DRAFT_7217577 [Phlegmacium glaucopus]|nr:hypothetical protein BYT27DRAFT_7217577 [Phlegmacium glaucopus]
MIFRNEGVRGAVVIASTKTLVSVGIISLNRSSGTECPGWRQVPLKSFLSDGGYGAVYNRPNKQWRWPLCGTVATCGRSMRSDSAKVAYDDPVFASYDPGTALVASVERGTVGTDRRDCEGTGAPRKREAQFGNSKPISSCKKGGTKAIDTHDPTEDSQQNVVERKPDLLGERAHVGNGELTFAKK